MRTYFLLPILMLCISCGDKPKDTIGTNPLPAKTALVNNVSLLILGNVQDAGSPHIACKKACCKQLYLNHDKGRKVVSLGLIDPEHKKTYLFEATPDIASQLKALKNSVSWQAPELPNGIFVTHAHIGHYSGLMYLGKEATNAMEVPVFTMPKMKSFLESNGPWGQLVTNKNIDLTQMLEDKAIALTSNLKVVPFTVPHRDEYSETVGFTIIGPSKKVLFIPDIDKWESWDKSIIEAVSNVDIALVDATFFDSAEVNNRDISEIPHPFVIETMALFDSLPMHEKRKIRFIHFNHTNPLLNEESEQSREVLKKGYGIARMNDVINL